ncbi:hypothetical protein B0J17DRAFT_295371 [Rhizoctonia solani]|nr:hypothetical protein B0J17DRAFT_295371 [Rhizoctonia solani]
MFDAERRRMGSGSIRLGERVYASQPALNTQRIDFSQTSLFSSPYPEYKLGLFHPIFSCRGTRRRRCSERNCWDNARQDRSRQHTDGRHAYCQATQTGVIQWDNSSPVEVDVRTMFATISIDATLEYSVQSKTTPQFDINLYSTYSPAILYTRDPRGTNSLANKTPPSILPLIHANVTSQYAMAQASVPATYHGSIELSSEYAAIATNDRAKPLANRSVSWKERVGMVYRGVVGWTTNGMPLRTGSVTVSTQFATARLMFLGLMDAETYRWQEEGTEIVYNLPVR